MIDQRQAGGLFDATQGGQAGQIVPKRALDLLDAVQGCQVVQADLWADPAPEDVRKGRHRLKEQRMALFSEDRVYRYSLHIIWDQALPLVQFIGLNPSTADEVNDDPTVRRCKSFARAWGAGGIVMTNIFAFRATDPKVMKASDRPVGEPGVYRNYWGLWQNRNDMVLSQVHNECTIRVACWGAHGRFMGREREVLGFLKPLSCLRINTGGDPAHPLYLPGDLRPVRFNGRL